MKRIVMLTAVVAGYWVTSVAADDSAAHSLVVLGESGRVARDQEVELALVVGGNLVVEGTVRGPAAAIGGNVELSPSAVVEEGVYAIGGVLQIDDRAQVRGARTQVAAGDFGEVVSQLSEHPTPQVTSGGWFGPLLRLAQGMVVLILGMLLAVLAPRHVQVVRSTMVRQPLKSALAGLVLLLGFVPLCALLAISLLGIPLIPLAVLALLGAFVMGLSGFAAGLGYRLPLLKDKDPDDLAGAVALGMLLIAAATLIPVLGGVLWFLASFYAAGAVIISRFGTRSPPTRSQPSVREDSAQSEVGSPGSVTP